jgi:hypothetical protein
MMMQEFTLTRRALTILLLRVRQVRKNREDAIRLVCII